MKIQILSQEELLSQYGDAELKFSSYYKYSFTFTGQMVDIKINATIGGSSDDIYRLDVYADQKMSLQMLDPTSVSIYKGQKLIAEYYGE